MQTDAVTMFVEERAYLALVKLEADSVEHAETLIRGGLSAAQAVGDLPTTYAVESVLSATDETEGMLDMLHEIEGMRDVPGQRLYAVPESVYQAAAQYTGIVQGTLSHNAAFDIIQAWVVDVESTDDA